MSDAAGAGAEAWSYDPMGRVWTDRRTTNSRTKDASYTYNLDGTIATLTYPSGRTIAYNLGNLWRRLGLPQRIKNWPLTSLQQRLVKTRGRLVKHARYYWLLLAEGHLSRRLFGNMLRMIAALPMPDG